MYQRINKQELKYGMYGRKSSEAEDRQIRSLEAQKFELYNVVEQLGLNIVKEIFKAESAKEHGTRSGFNNLLQSIKSGEINAVLVWSEDRLSRNAIDTAFLIDLMDKGFLKVVSTPYRDYFNTPQDKYSLTTQMSSAKQDNDKRSLDVKRGFRDKYKKGQFPGQAKQGYINTTEASSDGTIENIIDKDPERFELIKNAFHLVLYQNKTPMDALRILNNQWGYRTRKTKCFGGGKLSSSSWYKMLENPFYFGIMIIKGEEYQGSHPPMLTEEEFNNLQIICGKPTRKRTTKHNFLYKQYLTCGGCGGNVTAHEKYQVICSSCKTKFAMIEGRTSCINCDLEIEEMDNLKVLHYVYYNCTRRKDKNCSEGSLEVKRLEETVVGELQNIKISHEFEEFAIKYLDELEEKETQLQTRVSQNKDSTLKAIDTQLKELLALKISAENTNGELLSADEYKQTRQNLLVEKQKLLANQNINQKSDIELTREKFEFARYAKYWFENDVKYDKETIVDKLCLNLKIKDRKLHIDKKKAYFVIEETNKKEKAIKQEFEPKIKAGIKTKKDLEQVLIPSWQGRQESNPR